METNVLNGDQIGMIERTGESRLLLEADDELGVTSEGLVDDLESDVPSEPGVPRAIDFRHSPGAEGGEHFVRTQPAAGSQSHDETLPPQVPRVSKGHSAPSYFRLGKGLLRKHTPVFPT